MANRNEYQTGAEVRWKWGEGYGRGRVKSKFTEKTTRKIDGTEVTRDGNEDDPAYYIEVDGANNVLKLGSELEAD